MNSKGFKAQAAVDFMASYGFAILVILIAIIVIYEVGFGSVNGFTQAACNVQPGFSCDYVNLNTTGVLSLKLSQSIATNMKLNALACSTALNATGMGPVYGNVNVIGANSFYPSGENPSGMTFYSSSDSLFYINCYGNYGKLNGEAGKPVLVYVLINYTTPGFEPTRQLIITYDGAYT